MKILGIDEAGRGAVIGPLVICGALIDENKLSELVKLKVKDSKLLTENQRDILAPQIRIVLHAYEIVKISPKEIDSQRNSGISLNDIEAEKMAHLINEYKPDIVYVDAIDSDLKTFRARMNKFLRFTPKKSIFEHKADVKYPIVSAASILAKVERDEDVKALELNYGTIGSGYPSDPITVSFLKDWLEEHGKLPVEIIRETWSTAEAFKTKGKQKSLQDWLSK
ncbi:TPA: ribonuclease HII [archaeon]|uniref:Ribonuclease HII n=1 Tax=Candidatus Naiadarchaeum limnaeum TaxID=2756139 RepID=A0A832UVC2_9ARCH|nr:ribonuclease HII [Candidatus Naiadarchaeales archaeon SRR2090153.bin1042]HIK00385.1 ribonuclease HII [Candidatus Naiadarchaeum limnaeum]